MTLMLDARIYIADDEPANIALLQAVLGRAGFRSVTAFPDGQALLEAIAEPRTGPHPARPADAEDGRPVRPAQPRNGMPGGGYLPVLVLTADATRSSRDEALSSGAHDYLTKPFDPGEVLLRVRNLLETRRLHQELQTRNVDLSGQVEADDAGRWRTANGNGPSRRRPSAISRRARSAEATAQADLRRAERDGRTDRVLIVALDAAGKAMPLARDVSVDVGCG